VKFLDEVISQFDRQVLRFLTSDELQQRKQEFEDEVGRYDSNLNKMINDAYDAVDTKATAVLQHVSIMIAVTGVLFSQAGVRFRWLFGTEMLLYVVLALFCLRLLMAQHHSGQFSDIQNAAAKEAILDLTAKLTFIISVALIITVLAELVVK
jgi:hypothetical protein